MASITGVHLDLNLLVTLDALLDERSVTAAADRLYVTQPAMSRTLARIRQATGDQILVRSGRVMLPTPYAEQIRDEVHHLVTRANAVLTPATEVDPATLDRTFTVQCSDIVVDALVTHLAADLTRMAPGVCLRVLSDAADVAAEDLRRGRVDLQITNQVPAHADARSTTVLTDELAVIGRRDLPRPPSSWAALAALGHVVISRQGGRHNRVDDLLKERKLSRKVAFTVPTLALALRIVATHNLVVVAPRLLSGHALPSSLRSYPMPGPTSPIPAVLAWHARHDRDAAHRWLRALIADALRAITEH
ncbi:LysR family transcriptional regulator [Amycolatopsis sp. CA-230715]|uniref:LysR family transcriptional regulator n=1 Tax=Amycolatopsis sp. CA-230715 TaxID=2745196 RepID=UPI0020B20DEA|nr:LysR family transcriptional regulator [Amycolatopsis sp. CA-230715]